MKNLKKLNRNQQKEIKGAGPITKCKNSSQCGFGSAAPAECVLLPIYRTVNL